MRVREVMYVAVISIAQLRKDAERRRRELEDVPTRICVGQEQIAKGVAAFTKELKICYNMGINLLVFKPRTSKWV